MIRKNKLIRRLTAILLIFALVFCQAAFSLGESPANDSAESAAQTEEAAETLKWVMDFGFEDVEEDASGQPLLVNGYPVRKVRASFSSRATGSDHEYDAWFPEYPFWNPSTSYDPNLACMSLNLALSADRTDNATRDEDTSGSSSDIIRYMTDAGFSDIRLDDYDKIPSRYTVSTAMGSRVMEQEGKESFTLLAVAICGGNYRNEWVSNMTVGTGEFHEGFRYAAGLVTDRVAGYIASRNIKGRVKVWISGFSRSAAVSNITGGLITDSGMLPKEDVYVYTFATPAGVLNPPAEGYEHIYNILGATDIVPQVAPREWGFGRYGKDIILPAVENTSYTGMVISKMRQYSALSEFNIRNTYNPAMNLRLRLLVSMILQAVGSRDNYIQKYQSLIQSIMDVKTPSNMLANLRKIMLRQTGSDFDPDVLMNYIFRIMSNAAFRQEFAQRNNGDGSMLFRLANEHCEDSYLGSLHVLRMETFYNSSKFCYVMARGNVSLHLQDLDNHMDTITLTAQGKIVYHTDFGPEEDDIDMFYAERVGNASIIAVPMDGDYLVTWEAEGDGNVECMWVECSSTMTSVLPGARSGVIRAASGDKGTVFRSENHEPVVGDNFTKRIMDAGEMSSFLGVSSTVMYWRLIIMLVLGLATALLCILLCVYLAGKPDRRGRGFLFWFILIMLGIAAAEAEAAFWFFADRVIFQAAWKIVFWIGILLLFLLRSRQRGRNDLPWLAALILAVAGDLLYQFQTAVGTGVFLLLYLYLSLLFLKDGKMTVRQWVAWGLCSLALGGIILMIFRKTMGLQTWILVGGAVTALLALFASGSQIPRIRAAIGILLFSDLMLIIYNASEYNPLVHMAFAGTFAAAMILLSAGRSKESFVAADKEIQIA